MWTCTLYVYLRARARALTTRCVCLSCRFVAQFKPGLPSSTGDLSTVGRQGKKNMRTFSTLWRRCLSYGDVELEVLRVSRREGALEG